ncbi:MAG: 5'-methylthioadenosine phosphorylase [Kofleriaceae bacterium]
MIGLILGSAYHDAQPLGLELTREEVGTPYGEVTLHRVVGHAAVVIFRHGLPHRWLPHQIPYRAQATALARAGVTSLVVTSSVGILDPNIPLHEPLLIDDLVMLENQLPDGSTCTLFEAPTRDHGHLVLDEGICAPSLGAQIEALASTADCPIAGRVVFGYARGPRTKTAAENRAWRVLGAHVNSMSVGPELVLANELGIPTAGLVIGHKYSVPGVAIEPGEGLARSLDRGRARFDRLLRLLVEQLRPVAFGNRLYRFDA